MLEPSQSLVGFYEKTLSVGTTDNLGKNCLRSYSAQPLSQKAQPQFPHFMLCADVAFRFVD